MNRETSPSDGSPQVRALLRAGISEELDYDFERGLATHLAAIGLAPVMPHANGVPSATTLGSPSAATALSGKAILMLIGVPVVSASMAAAVWLGTGAHRPSPSGIVAQEHARVLDAPKPPLVATTTATASIDRTIAAPVAAKGAMSEQAPHPLRPSLRRHLAVALAESSDVPNAPGASMTSDGTNVAGSNVQEKPSTDSAGAAAATPPSPSAGEAATPENPDKPQSKPDELRRQAQERLTREMDELVQAKRALADDPNNALLLAERGQREFPHGVFVEERQQILLLSLIAVGRVEEARRLAAPYLQNHPDSPFARRVQQALVGK